MGSGAAAFLASRFRAPVRLRFRFAQATPDTLRSNGLRVAAPRVARKGEAWWARQDSNLQPDRYERPALTIELQAPPACRWRRQATVPTPLTMPLAIRQCWVPRSVFAMPRESGASGTPRPCGYSRRSAILDHPLSRVMTARARLNPPRRLRTPPPCAISRSHRQSACRIRPASSASGCRRFRPAVPPASDLSALRRPPC